MAYHNNLGVEASDLHSLTRIANTGFQGCIQLYFMYTDNRDKYLAMRFFEISHSADRELVERLVRTSQLASNAVKQERYRQRMKNYWDKMADRKPGQKVPEMPKQPKLTKPSL